MTDDPRTRKPPPEHTSLQAFSRVLPQILPRDLGRAGEGVAGRQTDALPSA